jgi:[protein-PII] uridylyltransferase
MLERFDRQVVQGTAAEFVAAKLTEREQRHRRSGQSRYLVEPNVKDGKGGLRDLHTLFWIAKYVYRVRDPEDLIAKGVFNRAEYRLFRRCEGFLWAVRCNMHFVAGRAEERLSFDIQRTIATRLGYMDRAGLRDVERFMKHYFLVAKNVGDLTAILSAKLESRQAKSVPMLNHVIARLKPRARRPLRECADFVVDNNRINIADPEVFTRDPVNLIRMFRLSQRHALAFHPDALHTATRSLRLIDKSLRENRQANELFREILTARHNAEIVLRRMNEAGVLGRFVPEFGRVVSMMQFNMYHHYTVDEHLLRCIGVLTEIETGDNPDYGLANDLIRTIQPGSREVLHIALFCHDIAKGRVEDHSIAGARVARDLCQRLGCSPAETETVVWLVEQHLVMSTLAQSRDLSDRKTIENFAAIVQSLERMKLLTILTTTDIRAVGPGVWNGWKAQLLRALYYETEPVLTGGFSEVDRARRVAEAQDEFRAELSDWPADELERYVSRLSPAYWLKVELPRRVAHARFVRAAQREDRSPAVDVGFDTARGVTELTVLAPDHPWLLSYLAGACAASGANIVNAQIYTTTDGMALDTIAISREFERDEDEKRRADRVAGAIEEASRLDLRLPDAAVKRRLPKGRFGAFAVEPEVIINNQWSNNYTVIEISGLDRPGLLYDLTAALSDLNLNIASAHVATFGERAVDVFYVTDLHGAKIVAPNRNAAIKRALLDQFAPAAQTA